MDVPVIKSYLRLTVFPSLSYFFLIPTYSFFPSTESEKDEFRLLCADGTRAPLSSFRTCNLGRGPGEGVVTRMNTRKIARKFLATAQVCFMLEPKTYPLECLIQSVVYAGHITVKLMYTYY